VAAHIGSWFEYFKAKALSEAGGESEMGTILIIVVLILLFGGGGGYYGYRRYGGPGLGGALGLVLIILLALWFFGGLRFNGP
jgi:hypothetical protein